MADDYILFATTLLFICFPTNENNYEKPMVSSTVITLFFKKFTRYSLPQQFFMKRFVIQHQANQFMHIVTNLLFMKQTKGNRYLLVTLVILLI